MDKARKRRFLYVAAGLASALIVTSIGVWTYGAYGRSNPSTKTETLLPAESFTYVGTEKIVIMLKPDERSRDTHYAVVDLVFKTKAENQNATREQILLLRSLVTSCLSVYSLDEIRNASIDELTKIINEAFNTSYKTRKIEKPFVTAMIGKLLAQ